MNKIVVWSTFSVRSPSAASEALVAALWERSTDPSEIAGALPWWVRWEVSDPEGLRHALRHGSDRPFATRLRIGGRLIPWTLHVTQAQAMLRCAVRGENALFATWEHRVRLERAIGGRVRLVHEIIAAPRVRPRRWAVFLAAQAVRAVHRELARHLTADEVARWRVVSLDGAMAAHAEDPLGFTDGEAPPPSDPASGPASER